MLSFSNELAPATRPAGLDRDGGLVLATRAAASAARHPHFAGLLASLAAAPVAPLEIANFLLVAARPIAGRANNARHGVRADDERL
jgi:hypothetical protein